MSSCSSQEFDIALCELCAFALCCSSSLFGLRGAHDRSSCGKRNEREVVIAVCQLVR